MEKIKYITNKELLAEIHKSKNSYCFYEKPEYSNYDAIVTDLSAITPEFITQVYEKKFAFATKKNLELPVKENLVFRLMTDEHIPDETDLKKRKRNTEETSIRTCFHPFKHYIMRDGSPVEVGRSHWKDGAFSDVHGKMTNRLAIMLMLLVERYSRRANWRGYTYNDEMRSHALLQLSEVGLRFNESKSDNPNPFAFYTTIIKNCLAGDTMILTREYGSVPIEEVSEQDVTLLDGNGDWVKCHIYDHGIQETQLTYFQGGYQRIGIRSTLNHGWVSNGERVETKDFHGNNTKIDDLRHNKIVLKPESYQNGVVHGLVYGDGHRIEEVQHAFGFTLCSHHDSIAPYMVKYSSWRSGKQKQYISYYIGKAWTDLKAFPQNPGEDLDYLLGFLRGWFAADGCLSKAQTPTLCGDVNEYEWFKKWGPLVGWHVNGYTKLADETNFGKRKKESCNFHLRKSSMEENDFIIEQHKKRWKQRQLTRKGSDQGNKYDWITIEKMREEGVKWADIATHFLTKRNLLLSSYSQYKKARDFKNNGVEREWMVYGGREQTYERRLERVYCPVVETTHTFALSCGIHGFNCFTRILNNEKKVQHIRDDLLIMADKSPSYTRQIEHEAEQKFEENKTDVPETTEKAVVPKKRGRKPKSEKLAIV